MMEKGQGLVEYALILMLVGAAVVSVLILFGEDLLLLYEFILDQIEIAFA
jgi:Flp pilus assembly pilin Flp